MLDIFGPASAPGAVTARPGDTRSFGAADTFFKDCSSPDLDDGTEFQAAWFNQILAAARALARGNGQTGGGVDIVTQDNADDAILLKAIQHLLQRNQPRFGVDTGTVNNMIVSLTPIPAELKKGMTIEVQAANAPSGATVLNLNGLGNKPVVKSGGIPLSGLEFLAGDIIRMSFDGANWQLPPTPAVGRLTANKTIYVNGAIGSDSNDGLSNAAGHAMATIQGAVNLAFGYSPSQYTITIVIEPGTYAGARTPLYAGPSLIVDGLNKANVTISAGSDFGFLVQGPNVATVQNVTVQNTAPADGNSGLAANSGASLVTSNTASNACGGGVFGASAGGTTSIGNHTFNGNCYACFRISAMGTMNLLQNSVYTFSSAITVAIATVFSGDGVLSVSATLPVTFVNPGNVTGPKYLAGANGVIDANGQGVNFFPGNSAGSTASGGQYI